MDATLLTGLTKIRRAGDTIEYWVYHEAVAR
jgi:hypothetical protein